MASPNVGRSLETGSILLLLTLGLAATGLALSPTFLDGLGLAAAQDDVGNALYVAHMSMAILLTAFAVWHLVPWGYHLFGNPSVPVVARVASVSLLTLVAVQVFTGVQLWRHWYAPLGKATDVMVHLIATFVIFVPLTLHAIRGLRVWLQRRAARRAAIGAAASRGREQEALAQQAGVTRRLFLRVGAYAAAGVALAAAFGAKTREEIMEWRLNSVGRTPQLEKETYELRITGLVNKPITLRWDDLMKLRQRELRFTHHCVEGWTYTDTFIGIPLPDVLALAGGVRAGAATLIFKSPETSRSMLAFGQQYTTNFPVDDGMHDDVLLVHKAHGEDLPREHGYPLRLMTPRKWGYKACKWLTEIEVSADGKYRGYWERAGYHNDGDYPGPIFG